MAFGEIFCLEVDMHNTNFTANEILPTLQVTLTMKLSL